MAMKSHEEFEILVSIFEGCQNRGIFFSFPMLNKRGVF